jgi:glycosyltransferase involved in cell wall biosynthesis
MILESPIDPMSVEQGKSFSEKLRLGMHSKPVGDKWNREWPMLVEEVHKEIGQDNVLWRFMGCPSGVQKELEQFSNMEFNKEFSITVGEFLFDLDVFVFFPAYRREEPWSRSIAEGIMSGCPVLATPKGGNVDQIVHGNNGFLCKNVEEYKDSIVRIHRNRKLLDAMRNDCYRRSKEFTSKKVIEKFLNFIGA